MKRFKYSYLLPIAMLVFAVGILAGSALAGPPDEKPAPPWDRGTDEEYEQTIRETWATRERFLAQFLAEGRNPRELPRSNTESYSHGPGSLLEAVATAQLVLEGQVASTEFKWSPSYAGPVATSTISITTPIKGTLGGPITVMQPGGPTPHKGGAVLEQMEANEVLLPGDEVVLMLQAEPGAGWYHAMPGAGVFFIVDGRVRPEKANRFGALYEGRTKVELISDIQRLVPQP